jgi:hypothetical protein
VVSGYEDRTKIVLVVHLNLCCSTRSDLHIYFSKDNFFQTAFLLFAIPVIGILPCPLRVHVFHIAPILIHKVTICSSYVKRVMEGFWEP